MSQPLGILCYCGKPNNLTDCVYPSCGKTSLNPFVDTPRAKVDVSAERCRKVLADVVAIINCATDEATDSINAMYFRDILAALRGPDEAGTASLKNQTTAVIRHRIGLRYGSGLDNRPGFMLCVKERYKKTIAAGDITPFHYHFLSHVMRAAIGIEKLEVNSESDPS